MEYRSSKIWKYLKGPDGDRRFDTEYIHHSKLHYKETAFYNLLRGQKFILAGFIFILGGFFALNWHITLITLFSFFTVIYFLDFIFNAFIIYRSFSKSPEVAISKEEIEQVPANGWPTYTIFCPLYKEWQVVPQFIAAMEKLDYPKEKLQILFLLEENDKETIQKIAEVVLPSHFETVVVPHSNPKTKPKAMNYGLASAAGEYLVIYDAEDVPESDQLKKAVLAFKKVAKNVACVQAKLNFYNPNQNLLTRMFTAEYSLWFDLILPGLQSINAPIPLGGTSNHFKTDTLRFLGGWDAFNVTEDCDLGLRLAKRGYRTAIVESTTYEEANSDVRNWFLQRSRWIKGYIQTYFVHTRDQGEFFTKKGIKDLLVFHLIVGGKVLALFINPVMWALTITYFLFRAETGLFIESLSPGPIYTLGVFSLVFGNFLYLYYYMVGCAKRGYNSHIKYVFLVPLYWLSMSLAAWKAVYEVIVKPHYWAKTHHGLHLGEKIKWEPSQVFGYVTSGAGMLVMSSLAANLLNFVFNAFLSRELTLEEFGLVTVINTFAALLSLFINALSTSINRTVSYLEGRNLGRGSAFLRKKWLRIFLTSFAGSVLWVLLIPITGEFFNISGQTLMIAFAPVIFLGALDSVNKGFLKGTLNFGHVALATIAETVSKLGFAFVLVVYGFTNLAAIAIPGSILFAWLISSISTFFVYRRQLITQKDLAAVSDEPFPFKLFSAAVMSGLAIIVFTSIDVLLAKHYLGDAQAGEYSILSLVGKMIFFFGTLFNVFIVTLVGRAQGKGENPFKIFSKLFGVTFVLTLGAGLSLMLFGSFLVPLLLGEQARSIVQYLPLYSFAIMLFTLSATIVTYELAKKRYLFSGISLAMAGLVMTGIYFSHSSIESFVRIIAAVNVMYLSIVLLAELSYNPFVYIGRNIRDILSVFKALPKPGKLGAGGKRILILNWRDEENVFAGGAEVYIHALASRWAHAGNSVTLFCSNDGTQEPNAVIGGVRVIRRGGFFAVYIAAAVYYFFHFRKNIDVIVDCENGVPFFSPFYASEPVFCLLHHVHQDVFRKSLPLPLALFASFLEGRVMPFIYRYSRFITISQSSKRDMEELRITAKEIEIVHPGIDLKFLVPGKKSLIPLVSYLGRLKDYKSVDLLIAAFAKILAKVPEARLIIAGDGDERNNLLEVAKRFEVTKSIQFTGKISEKKKLEILQRSWVFVNPSMMEGWGITTIEANACGTPVVASDVPGLRDAVRNNETGYLTPYGNIDALSDKIILLLTDTPMRESFEANAIKWAKNFDWNKSSENFINIISGNFDEIEGAYNAELAKRS